MLTALLTVACLTPTELTVEVGDSAGTEIPDSDEPSSGTLDTSDGETGEPEDTEPGDVDNDGDGYDADVDCDDNDPDVHPLQYDDCDGQDDDCDDIIDEANDCPCPINWFADHAYLFCEDRRDFREAASECADLGYFLVTVSSDQENSWLHETSEVLSGQEWWTGFNDQDDEGTFTWLSGEAVNYTNWADGEPNDYGRGEDCAPIHSARSDAWNDVSCDNDYRWICEAE
jgi:hypothetical protein